MESAGSDRVLVFRRLLDAPRPLVFRVWTEPAHLARWWGPHNFTLPVCEVDFRVGGAYRFCMRSPGGSDHWVWGVYQAIEAPAQLSFSWNRTEEPGQANPWAVTQVTLTLADRDGKTELTLHQAVFPRAEECADHRGGWTECLVRLASYVLSSAPESRQLI